MRETRMSGSEGGGAGNSTGPSHPYQFFVVSQPGFRFGRKMFRPYRPPGVEYPGKMPVLVRP